MQCVCLHLVEVHPKLDFSCFGDETVETVKKYAANAASKEVAEASPAPNLIEVDPPAEDAGNPTP